MPKKIKKKNAKPKKKISAKKSVLKKKAAKLRKPLSKPLKAKSSSGARPSKSDPPKAKLPVKPSEILGEYVGVVTHYFPHVQAAAIKIEKGNLKIGDGVRFKGHTTDYQMVVNSLELDHKVIPAAHAGDEVGVRIADRVRPGDKVYKP